jgi:tetratricopeptide (TPR) repeat protein
VLLDDYGRYSDQVIAILGAMLKYKDTYLVLIHRRRPEIPTFEEIKQGLVYYRLNPLKLEDTEKLLQQRLKLAGVKATSPQVRDLAIYMEGYPPSVDLASNYAREYGLGTLLSDKATLVDFQVRTFTPILDKFHLIQIEKDILKILGNESALPLEAVALVLEKTEAELVSPLRHLIDLSLVIPFDINFTVAAPVKEAVQNLFGHFTTQEYRSIGQKILAKYWTNKNIMPELAIVDMTIHVLANSDAEKLQEFSDLILPSQLLRVAKEAYDNKDWDKATDFAKRTLVVDPTRILARTILIKGYVRKDQWNDAERELEKIRGLKGYFYCKGFFEWKRGNLAAAISAFKSALDSGDTRIAVYRDLAHCLFRHGQLNEAKTVLNNAPHWIFRNSYVVDVAAQIAIAQKDPKAKEYISTLEHIASPEIFHLRRSMLYASFSKWTEALQDAEAAYVGDNPSFQVLCQKADVLIEMGDFLPASKAIEALKPPNTMKRDVKIGLKCKMLLRQNQWREAEVQFIGIHDKEASVARMIYRTILEQKALDPKVTNEEKESAKLELKKIGKLLEMPFVTDDEDEVTD